jgi:hypothetical protein
MMPFGLRSGTVLGTLAANADVGLPTTSRVQAAEDSQDLDVLHIDM